MEKAHIKYVPVSPYDFNELFESSDRRYWTIDYPLLSYVKSDRSQLRICHLADNDAPKKEIELSEEEEFVAFVDKFPDSYNA